MSGIAGCCGERVLFLDMEAVAARRNVIQTVVEAEKHASNPVLPLGDVGEWDSLQVKPWASRSVIYDDEEQLFKCWYTGIDIGATVHTTGYAISENGVDWIKPRLGLFEYNGNKDNNICIESGYGPVWGYPFNRSYHMFSAWRILALASTTRARLASFKPGFEPMRTAWTTSNGCGGPTASSVRVAATKAVGAWAMAASCVRRVRHAVR